MLIRSGLHLTYTAGPSRLVSPNVGPPPALRLSSWGKETLAFLIRGHVYAHLLIGHLLAA